MELLFLTIGLVFIGITTYVVVDWLINNKTETKKPFNEPLVTTNEPVTTTNETIVVEEKVVDTKEKTTTPKRARKPNGRFKGDDKTTLEVNEAWVDNVAPVKSETPKPKKRKPTMKVVK